MCGLMMLQRGSGWLVLAALGVVAGLTPAGQRRAAAQSAPATRPNIVFILADDLGYGDLGCYGQQRIRTPQIDRLAREGLRFTDFYAGSTVCAPSRCVLMTGYHTGHAHIRGNAGRDRPEIQMLRPQDLTVAEILQQAGYATALCGKWGLGDEGSVGVPTRQGFDYFYGYLNQFHAHNYYPAYLFENERRVPLANVVPGPEPFGTGVATQKRQYSADLITQAALDWLSRQGDRPFFLYYAPTLPHANNEAGQEGMEVPELGAYAQTDWPPAQKAHAAMISRLDADVGKILALLEAKGLDRNTLVFFSSDNGPHREGGNDPDFNDSNGPLRGIKRDLTEGGIRVPMIARWKGVIAPGVSNHVGAFEDMLPTLAELAGASQAVPADTDGISLVPTLLGRPEQQRQHDYLYWVFYERGGGQAARQGPWKAVQQPIHSPLRLYRLDRDLGEEHDLAAAEPEMARRMAEVMRMALRPHENWSFPPPDGPGPKKGKKTASTTPRP
jgi:arylsulfatase A-like enzyme